LWDTASYAWDAMGNMLNSTMAKVSTGPDNLAVTNPKHFKPPNKPKKKGSGAAGPFIGRTLDFTYAQTTYGTTTSLLSSVALNGLSHSVGSDAVGNQTSYFVTRSYSPRNLPAQVQDIDPETQQTHTLGYGYDGRNVRVERTESPSNGPGTSVHRFFVYTPELSLLAATRDDGTNIWGGNPPTSFARNIDYEIVWFAGRPVAQIAPDPASPARNYTFADHLGTPLLQVGATPRNTDGSFNITWRVEYEPFGNVYEVRAGTRTDQPLRFPGQEMAMTFEGPEDNYNIFRWYRSSWGRYSSADPVGQVFDLNVYRYGFANPTRYSDRFGLQALPKPMPQPTPPGFPRPLPPPSCPMPSTPPAIPPWLGVVGGWATAIGGFFFGPFVPEAGGPGDMLPEPQPEPQPKKCNVCDDHDQHKDDCYSQYLDDIETCKSRWPNSPAGRALCYASAAERLAACNQHRPIPRLQP
jgi:RHS repeat-associated protein